jgi:hypothetical protein
MFIVKVKSRRRNNYRIDQGFYFSVGGSFATESVEEAVDVAFDVWAEQIKTTPAAPTIWTRYNRRNNFRFPIYASPIRV